MSHDLATTNGRTAMAYYGEKPWHGLGTELDAPATAEEAIAAAGLDFVVNRAPLVTQDGTPVPQRKAVVRSDTNQVLGVVGDQSRRSRHPVPLTHGLISRWIRQNRHVGAKFLKDLRHKLLGHGLAFCNKGFPSYDIKKSSDRECCFHSSVLSAPHCRTLNDLPTALRSIQPEFSPIKCHNLLGAYGYLL